MPSKIIKPLKQPSDFSDHLLSWFDLNGRKDLPWKKCITPYRVWVSEIMLQQTQVNTVLPYFHNFILRFPDLSTLAASNIDTVLYIWSGLGYYNRAHNLHKSAKILKEKYNSHFPRSVKELMQLPGIGRSTAGAIAAISMNIPAPILDGNVKRILTRYHMIKGAPEKSSVSKKLWDLAEYYTPKTRIADYTQAIMDLGSKICTKQHPKCNHCPLLSSCQANYHNTEGLFPEKTIKKKRVTKSIYMLIFINKKNDIFLEKRTSSKIWPGLWSFPEINKNICSSNYFSQKNDNSINKIELLPTFQHNFTHFSLSITPVKISLSYNPNSLTNNWFSLKSLKDIGIPKPTQQLTSQLKDFFP